MTRLDPLTLIIALVLGEGVLLSLAWALGAAWGLRKALQAERAVLSGRGELVLADAEAQQKRNLKALPGGRNG